MKDTEKRLATSAVSIALAVLLFGCAALPSVIFSSCGNDKAQYDSSDTHDTTSAPDDTTTENTSAPDVTTENTSAPDDTTAENTSVPDDTYDIANGDEIIGTKYSRAFLLSLDNEKIGYGQGLNVDSDNRPTGVNYYIQRYEGYDITCIGEKSDKIYLTFDMGYENGTTPAILDTLREKNVHALFFLTGHYAKTQPDLVRRMIDEGHILGNHGMYHQSLPDISIDDAVYEIMSLHEYVKENFGYEMHYFRPPCGESSVRSVALTESLGYRSVMWSFAYYDYNVNDQPNFDSALERTVGAAHGGAVYLLHAVSQTNTDILPYFIDRVREKGFRFCKLDV